MFTNDTFESTPQIKKEKEGEFMVWDYKNEFLNVNGRICLVGLLAFGLGSLFGVYIAAPKLSEFLNSKSKKVQNIIWITLSVLFIIDLICCAIFGFNKGEGVGGTY